MGDHTEPRDGDQDVLSLLAGEPGDPALRAHPQARAGLGDDRGVQRLARRELR